MGRTFQPLQTFDVCCSNFLQAEYQKIPNAVHAKTFKQARHTCMCEFLGDYILSCSSSCRPSSTQNCIAPLPKHQVVDIHRKLKVTVRAFQYFGDMMKRVVTFPIRQLYPEKRVHGFQRTELPQRRSGWIFEEKTSYHCGNNPDSIRSQTYAISNLVIF